MKRYIINLFIMFLTSLVLSLILTPLMRKVANHVGALDIPGKRHIHNKITPKLGGLAIFWSFFLSYLIFDNYNPNMLGIIAGAFLITILGLMDDIKPIGYKAKFLGEIIAILLLIFFGDLLLKEVTLFGYTIDLGIFAYPITLFFLLACTNIINLIDGLDGLAGGVSSIFFFTITVITLFQKRFGTLEINLSILLLGATIGFLKYNFHPAKIFMGDTGALFLGYMVGVLSLIGFKKTMISSLAIPLLLLAVPVIDTLFAIIRRVLKGESPFKADSDHMHHQFLKMKFDTKETVIIIYIIQLLFSLTSILYTLKDKLLGTIIYMVLIIGVIWFVFHTDIISQKINKKKKGL